MVYPHPIDMNCLPHCDVFTDNGYTKEEMKLVNETQKILNDYNIRLTATAVRVPVVGGHSESVNIEFAQPFDIQAVKEILQKTDGVLVVDNPEANEYPMPIHAKNRNEVLVGRIRRDHSLENSLNLWIVADNLRKGAATNAVQIVDLIHKMGLVGR
jgi:aspartate-semialdehyde dehydrogenase